MATINVDWNNVQLLDIEIDENTTFTFTDIEGGAILDYRIVFIKVTNINALLPRNLTWPSNMLWPSGSGQNSVGANKTDIFQILIQGHPLTETYSYLGNVYGNNYSL